MKRNPFIYGRPVKQKEFINRKNELSMLFGRIANGESSAVVGAPHTGKTSLLLQVADPQVQDEYLGDDAQKRMFVFVDLHPVDSSYTPNDFWERALESLCAQPGSGSVSRKLKDAAQAGYTSRSLEKVFAALEREERGLVLLLDEFDRLLIHPNFRDPTFFASLRSLSTRVGGLSYITASRLSVDEMNERGRGYLDTGSPFFNNVIPVNLGPLNDEAIDLLLDRAGDLFTNQDRLIIRRLAGRNPFLMQAMAAALYQSIAQGDREQAAELFYSQVAFHFDDLWYTLDDRTRTAAVILSLVASSGIALGQEYSFGEIENTPAFGPELRRLAEHGLAEIEPGPALDTHHIMIWRGERWTVSCHAFNWWVRDVVIAGTRTTPTSNEWLKNKRYTLLLTQEQWDRLITVLRSAPAWATGTIAALARGFLEGLFKK